MNFDKMPSAIKTVKKHKKTAIIKSLQFFVLIKKKKVRRLAPGAVASSCLAKDCLVDPPRNDTKHGTRIARELNPFASKSD